MVIFGMGDQVCCKVGMGGFLEKVGGGRLEIETFIFLPISLSDEIQDMTYSRIQFENERNAFLQSTEIEFENTRNTKSRNGNFYFVPISLWDEI